MEIFENLKGYINCGFGGIFGFRSYSRVSKWRIFFIDMSKIVSRLQVVSDIKYIFDEELGLLYRGFCYRVHGC